jgi:UDP-glucose 6-dehydrogenase
MKSIEKKRTEALARNLSNLEMWQRLLKQTDDNDKDQKAHLITKIKNVERDISNLRRKLSSILYT